MVEYIMRIVLSHLVCNGEGTLQLSIRLFIIIIIILCSGMWQVPVAFVFSIRTYSKFESSCLPITLQIKYLPGTSIISSLPLSIKYQRYQAICRQSICNLVPLSLITYRSFLPSLIFEAPFHYLFIYPLFPSICLQICISSDLTYFYLLFSVSISLTYKVKHSL